jgi:DNA primase small subunit
MRKYYQTTFPVDRIVEVITHRGAHSLHNVCFAFRWGEDIFKRYDKEGQPLGFDSAQDLKSALIAQAPDTINVEFPEDARPLVFDVDIHDYADIARLQCNCEPKQVCNVCWVQIMRPEMRKARDFLCDFIGFDEVTFVFSGRKGFHIWVTDDCVWTWNTNARLNYVQRMPVRCDVPITVCKKHLIKLPWTLHQKTKKLACVIENIDTWLPN